MAGREEGGVRDGGLKERCSSSSRAVHACTNYFTSPKEVECPTFQLYHWLCLHYN